MPRDWLAGRAGRLGGKRLGHAFTSSTATQLVLPRRYDVPLLAGRLGASRAWLLGRLTPPAGPFPSSGAAVGAGPGAAGALRACDPLGLPPPAAPQAMHLGPLPPLRVHPGSGGGPSRPGVWGGGGGGGGGGVLPVGVVAGGAAAGAALWLEGGLPPGQVGFRV
jgi:hypothetical protein